MIAPLKRKGRRFHDSRLSRNDLAVSTRTNTVSKSTLRMPTESAKTVMPASAFPLRKSGICRSTVEKNTQRRGLVPWIACAQAVPFPKRKRPERSP